MTPRTGRQIQRMPSLVSKHGLALLGTLVSAPNHCGQMWVFISSDKMGSKRRSSDIISLLVSIYGSKDIFIDEYRAVLADRLLHQLNYNTARLGIKDT